jgi:hypothetical protein
MRQVNELTQNCQNMAVPAHRFGAEWAIRLHCNEQIGNPQMRDRERISVVVGFRKKKPTQCSVSVLVSLRFGILCSLLHCDAMDWIANTSRLQHNASCCA